MGSLPLLILWAAVSASAGDASPAEKRQAFRLWDEGIALVLKDSPEGARAKWQQCLDLDPDSRDCRAGLKLLGASAPAGSVAADPAPAQALSDPKEARRLWDEGFAHYQKQRYASAKNAWTECLRLDPRSAACMAGMKLLGTAAAPAAIAGGSQDARRLWAEGLVHFQKMNYEGAAKSWLECLRFDPDSEDCRTGLARVTDYLPQSGPVPVAVSTAVGGASGDEGRRRAALRHWHAGIIYFQAGKKAQARDEWALCVEFDPSNTDCQTGLARIDSAP